MSRSSIESDYEFGAYDDDYRGFDIRDDESNRGPLILALALGILIVFGAVVWNTYRQGVRTTDGGLPIIAGSDAPYKSAPDERGGAATPDLNARIYDQIDGGARSDAQGVPGAPQGLQSETRVPEGDALQGGPSKASEGDPIIIEQARKLEEMKGNVSEGEREDYASRTPPSPRQLVNLEPQVSVQPAEASRFAFRANGEFLVQISALRSRESAERAWREANRKSPDLFKGSSKRIQRADLGSKGVFYRLRVGAFSERSSAAEFCDALKSAKHQCIVVQN